MCFAHYRRTDSVRQAWPNPVPAIIAAECAIDRLELRNQCILWSCVGALAACARAPEPPPPKAAPTLVIAMRPGPTTWFTGPDGDAAGLDRDLADLFAAD